MAKDWLEGVAPYYDVIVIGSGLAGLTGANTLAKQGHSVLLLEQHYQYGGLATWFKRKGGHIFDISLHGFPIGMIKSCRKYWTQDIASSVVQLKGIRFVNPQFDIETTFDRADFSRILITRFGVPQEKVEEFFNTLRAMNFYDDNPETTGEFLNRFFGGRRHALEFALEKFLHAVAIGQAGERVVQRQMLDTRPRLHFFGDVADRAAVAASGGVDSAQRQAAGVLAAVGRQIVALQAVLGRCATVALVQPGEQIARALHQVAQRAAQPGAFGMRGNRLKTRGQIAQTQLAVGFPNPIRCRLSDIAKTRLAGGQGQLAGVQRGIAGIHLARGGDRSAQNQPRDQGDYRGSQGQ
jgi:hypothetical protein